MAVTAVTDADVADAGTSCSRLGASDSERRVDGMVVERSGLVDCAANGPLLH
jgi:hypothetical protein